MITSYFEYDYGRPTVKFCIDKQPAVIASLEDRQGPYASISWGDVSVEYIEHDCEGKMIQDLARIASGATKECMLIHWLRNTNGAVIYPDELFVSATKDFVMNFL